AEQPHRSGDWCFAGDIERRRRQVTGQSNDTSTCTSAVSQQNVCRRNDVKAVELLSRKQEATEVVDVECQCASASARSAVAAIRRNAGVEKPERRILVTGGTCFRQHRDAAAG